MTSLVEEIEEQKRWRLLPDRQRYQSVFNRIVRNEFEDPNERKHRLVERLRRKLIFAQQQTHHYREVFAKARFRPELFENLEHLLDLPILTRASLEGENASMLARQVPARGGGSTWYKSTGTTGPPTKVLRSRETDFLFAALAQRCYRWYRMNPEGSFASLRFASHLPRQASGEKIKVGSGGQKSRWQMAGGFFHTGRWHYFTGESPVEEHLSWLTDIQPDYLQSYSENLEHLILACEGEWPVPSIKGMMGISEQMTPSMRKLIESKTGARVDDSYGLNEIGLVANRCSSGRYHVHTEQCVVEIVREDGSWCGEGETGRLVATSLSNWCMPMIRYDTGDLARATYQACPCGRTLPSFKGIVGRYSRVAFLPENTWVTVLDLREELESLPKALLKPIRQFQVVQRKDLMHDLHLVVEGKLDSELEVVLQKKWSDIAPGTWGLRIKRVEHLHRSAGGKFEFLLSEFNPGFDLEEE